MRGADGLAEMTAGYGAALIKLRETRPDGEDG